MDTTWGPDSRPAAVTLVFEGLAAGEDLDGGRPDATSVTPALPTILRALGDRDLSATWLVGAAVGEAEPLALTMLRNAGNDVAPPSEEREAPAVRDAAFLAPVLAGMPDADPRGVDALHQALQVAVADALQARAHATLAFTPGLLERADSLAVFVETLELIEGLRDVERLWVPTLRELAEWRAAG